MHYLEINGPSKLFERLGCYVKVYALEQGVDGALQLRMCIEGADGNIADIGPVLVGGPWSPQHVLVADFEGNVGVIAGMDRLVTFDMEDAAIISVVVFSAEEMRNVMDPELAHVGERIICSSNRIFRIASDGHVAWMFQAGWALVDGVISNVTRQGDSIIVIVEKLMQRIAVELRISTGEPIGKTAL